MDKLYLVGCGVGDKELLTVRAKKIISEAGRVLSTGRLSQNLDNKNVENCTLAELAEKLRNNPHDKAALLVSGDCGFFSVSKSIIESFSAQYEIELINGISSIQYLSAKIAVPYDDALICSMHGRDGRIIPKVAYNEKVFVLTGGEFKACDICSALVRSGLSDVEVLIGERLSYPEERIVEGTAGELKDTAFDGLSVMCIINKSFTNPHLPLYDKDFCRGDVPMTKEEVRWLSIQKLGIAPTDTVYDIGAGTGSVSVEMARRAFDGYVYAVEMKAEACGLIEKNRTKHGAYNVEIIRAKAPEGIADLPIPDKAFIGGSSGNIKEIISMLIRKNTAVKIVSNAVTLQSLHQITDAYEAAGLDNIDTVCVNIAKAKKIKNYDIMQAQNPVYIITGKRGDTNE